MRGGFHWCSRHFEICQLTNRYELQTRNDEALLRTVCMYLYKHSVSYLYYFLFYTAPWEQCSIETENFSGDSECGYESRRSWQHRQRNVDFNYYYTAILGKRLYYQRDRPWYEVIFIIIVNFYNNYMKFNVLIYLNKYISSIITYN